MTTGLHLVPSRKIVSIAFESPLTPLAALQALSQTRIALSVIRGEAGSYSTETGKLLDEMDRQFEPIKMELQKHLVIRLPHGGGPENAA